MKKLLLPTYKVGMIVVTPSSNVPHLTEDKAYTILDIEGEWFQIQDDSNEIRYYQSHLFIEPDVYYNMIMYLTLLRMLDLKPSN